MEFNKHMFNQENNNQQENTIDNDPLTNISLSDSNTNNNTNKKKYLLLGAALFTLFVVTVLIIRFISNVNEDPLIVSEKSNIKQDNILENIDAEQRYQEIIQKRVETLKQEEDLKTLETKEEADNKIQNKELDTTEEVEPVEKQAKEKITPKKEFKVPTAETTIFNTSNKLNGSYVQLGAFSQYPKKQYIQKIKNKNYEVVIHKVQVNGKYYHKVLVGPFKSQNISRAKLSKIRKELNSPKAFIYQ